MKEEDACSGFWKRKKVAKVLSEFKKGDFVILRCNKIKLGVTKEKKSLEI